MIATETVCAERTLPFSDNLEHDLAEYMALDQPFVGFAMAPAFVTT
jgi:hypothetical protein